MMTSDIGNDLLGRVSAQSAPAGQSKTQAAAALTQATTSLPGLPAGTAAVLPIKQLADAKQRLAGLLQPEERSQLFTCMVEDVLTAVESCPLIDRILVVTNDAAVADMASAYSAETMPEPSPPGLSAAVAAAGRALAAEAVHTLLFLPGDLPLVTPDEIEVALGGGVSGHNPQGQDDDQPEGRLGGNPGESPGQQQARSPGGPTALPPAMNPETIPAMTIVPASDLGGSNCIACSPPDCMEFAFGVGSFRRHLGIARSRGMNPEVVKLPGIGLDVDTPEDLRQLLALAPRIKPDCHTIRYLVSSGIIGRL